MSKTNLVSAKSAIAAAHDLRAVMHGEVALPGDEAYASSRRIWNGTVDHRPACARTLRTLACLQDLATPILTQISPMSYTDLIGLCDAQVVNGRHYALRTHWRADLTPDILLAGRSRRGTDLTAFLHRPAPLPRGRHTTRS